MQRIICPSMMCADFSNLESEVKELDQGGADIFHIDIMDGAFVPNFGMGLQDFELIRNATKKLVDVHLMIMNPMSYVEKFAEMGADIIYIHPEADLHPARTIDEIHRLGKKAGIAINPGTSIESISELIEQIDYLMIMTVNPGFAGQAFLEYTIKKIKQACLLKEENNFKLMVDGAISPNKIYELSELGVDGFVLGTSALFKKEKNYEERISKFKNSKLLRVGA